MENSRLISGASSGVKILSFAYGDAAGRGGAPMRVAWALEQTALHFGWREDLVLGCERDLIENHNVGRDKLREAVRLVEARGSMEMQRGRTGGLRLRSPGLGHVAGNMAAYLDASGCTAAELKDMAACAKPVFAVLGEDHLLVRLTRDTLQLFCAGSPAGDTSANLAGAIAARITRSAGPIPEAGIFLGNEQALCDRLACTRPALRQALCVLGDLAVLKVRNGRGGGFSLMRPSPAGAVRQLFGLIASHHQTLEDVVAAVWALNLVRLRLAAQGLRRFDRQERETRCDALAALLDDWPEPDRWFLLHRALGDIANSRFLNALVDGFMAYQARLGLSRARYGQIDDQLRCSAKALVAALRKDDPRQAERHHMNIHGQISRLLKCRDLSPILP